MNKVATPARHEGSVSASCYNVPPAPGLSSSDEHVTRCSARLITPVESATTEHNDSSSALEFLGRRITHFGGLHRYAWTVDVDDTDFTGLVFHVNYARHLSRARTALLGAAVIRTVAEQCGLSFSIRRMNMKFRRPARFGEQLEIATDVILPTPNRLLFSQRVSRVNGEYVVEAETEAVCIAVDGRPRPIPLEQLVKLYDTRRGHP